MIVHTMPQRSPAWYQVRLGLLTASCAADMLAKVKSGGEAAARRDLRLRLCVERLTGVSQDENGYLNEHMTRGIEKEADAVRAYEAQSGNVVERVGFCSHDSMQAGCSPDGLIDGGQLGVLEVKCPKSATHLRYVRAAVAPPEYVPQLVHLAWITGAGWVDFVSFDDRFPPELQLFVVRYQPSDIERKSYELAASLFLSEVEREVAEVQGLGQEVTHAV